MNGQDEKQRTKKIKEILKSGLEDLVNVNSLLSIAVFVGLTYATPGQRSLENRLECDAELRHAKNLVVLEVIAFSFFLFSSLVAKSLKLMSNLMTKTLSSIHQEKHVDVVEMGVPEFVGVGVVLVLFFLDAFDDLSDSDKVGKAVLQEPMHTRSNSLDDCYCLCWYAHLSTSSRRCST